MTRIGLLAGAVLAAAGAAQGQVILTFGYTDVEGSFSTATSEFTGRAVPSTSGDVTRTAAPGGTADFDDGFAGDIADFKLDLSVLLTTPSTADGTGTFEIIDADGDTITGSINGEFETPGSGIVFFNGTLSDVFLNDNGDPDGTFDGTDGGSFGLDLPGTAPFDGAFVQLFIGGTGGFFDRDFSGVSAQVDGIIVPAPAAAALFGLGGLAALRRRRC